MSLWSRLFVCAFLSYLQSVTASSLKQVTCGSLVKLKHSATNFRLHSHDIPYGQGSGQQSVTGFPDPDDSNSYWIIRGTQESPCHQGSPISKKQRIRLQHSTTRRWLHSHLHYSPISRNQEVSAFGDDDRSDGGDVWIIEWDGGKKVWDTSIQFRLKHVDTEAYLITHEKKYSNPIRGQQEVCAVKTNDKRASWESAEGVYFSKSAPQAKDEL